jgi:hypothetical protein
VPIHKRTCLTQLLPIQVVVVAHQRRHGQDDEQGGAGTP